MRHSNYVTIVPVNFDMENHVENTLTKIELEAGYGQVIVHVCQNQTQFVLFLNWKLVMCFLSKRICTQTWWSNMRLHILPPEILVLTRPIAMLVLIHTVRLFGSTTRVTRVSLTDMRNINNPALQAERLVLLPDKSNLFYQGHTGLRSRTVRCQ